MRELASVIFLIFLVCIVWPEGIRDAVKTIRSGFASERTVTFTPDP